MVASLGIRQLGGITQHEHSLTGFCTNFRKEKGIMNLVTSQIKAFKELFSEGIKKINEACRLYVQAIDANPAAKDQFMKEFPQIPEQAWNRFESVGRGLLYPELVYTSGALYSRISRFPVSQQKAISDNGVEVLCAGGDSFITKIENLTPEQVQQVFTKDGIRTLAQQKAYIESKKLKETVKTTTFQRGYVVQGKKVIITEPLELTAKDLARLLSEVTK